LGDPGEILVHCMAQVGRGVRHLVPVALNGLFAVLQFGIERSNLDVFFAQLALQGQIFRDHFIIMNLELLALFLGVFFLIVGLFSLVLDDFQPLL
jgi:hypothetical protein